MVNQRVGRLSPVSADPQVDQPSYRPEVRWIAVVGAALALAPAASTAALPKPCALLTNAQVAKLLGSKIDDRVASGNGRYLACKWMGASLGSYAAVQRSLMLQVSRTTKAQFTQAARRAQGAARVRGVGEAAYVENGGGNAFLTVYARGYVLQLSDAFVTSSLGVEKAAAKLAVARL
jgi:hypothetical protein